jgi:hypothetical protein
VRRVLAFLAAPALSAAFALGQADRLAVSLSPAESVCVEGSRPQFQVELQNHSDEPIWVPDLSIASEAYGALTFDAFRNGKYVAVHSGSAMSGHPEVFLAAHASFKTVVAADDLRELKAGSYVVHVTYFHHHAGDDTFRSQSKDVKLLVRRRPA